MSSSHYLALQPHTLNVTSSQLVWLSSEQTSSGKLRLLEVAAHVDVPRWLSGPPQPVVRPPRHTVSDAPNASRQRGRDTCVRPRDRDHALSATVLRGTQPH